ncbi:MAG: helix-turn-helix domain-containing protein [Acidimicrobiales bacterium]
MKDSSDRRARKTTVNLDVGEVDSNAGRATCPVPDFLNVREASKVLRLSRNRTYELANLYIESGGASGLPAFRFGRPIRIPRLALEAYIGGPLTWPPVELQNAAPDDVDLDDDGEGRIEHASALDANSTEPAESASIDGLDQPSLPFEG